MITRRHFLASTAASLCIPSLAFADETMRLRAEPVKLDLLPDQGQTLLWGFNGSTPGPTIRTRKGGRVKVRFENALKQFSAVHWHGIRIDNKMDGVPGLTQSQVPSGNDFLYDFVVPDAGTYWYHSHDRSWEQVARGLYGALIVEEENPPLVDHDIIVFVDDWRLNRDGSQAGDFENMHDQAHAGRMGNFAKAIFQGVTSPIKLNQRIRLRFINVATDRIFPLQLTGVDGKIIAYDGMSLETSELINNLTLAPAQRADIIADVTGEKIEVDFRTRDGLFRLGSLTVQGLVDQTTRTEIILPVSNRYESPDLENAVQLTLQMEGGAMSRRMMMGGMMGGDVWAFNGISGMTDTPFYKFKAGQTGVIELVNDTRFPHAIHLHGHHFQAIASGGMSPLRDTILVDAGKTTKIACVFDNPGKWLLHCHMLAHQAAGMKTWVEVA